MATSLGLSHETYSSYPLFPPLVAADSAAALNFPPAAMPNFPELDVVLPPDYSPPPVFAAGGNEMNMYGSLPMSYCNIGDDAARRVISRGGSNGGSSARIGFRTRSEVEIMDDGFKWRKYGKKAVKSSPNLRNYYRCSAEGCGVKKRVERDRDDPRYVLTTYDGVHNHAAPCTGTGGHLIGRGASPAAAYSAPAWLAGAPAWSELRPTGLAAAPTVDEWGAAQLHAAAHSSGSSY